MSQGHILLISDSNTINKSIVDILSARDYAVTVANDAQSGINGLENSLDLVVLKYGLIGCDTGELVKQIYSRDNFVTMLLLVEDRELRQAREAAANFVFDCVVLPVEAEKFTCMVRTAIQIHSLNVQHRKVTLSLQEKNASLQKQNNLLARRLEEYTRNLQNLYDSLRSTYMRTIRALAQAIDARDHYTHSHSQNVTSYAMMIAEELGLSAKDKETIRQACELHDIGKIGIDDRILTKPGPLNEEEWEIIKGHSIKGAQILEPLAFLGAVITIVRQHHERYDGKGYPDGLKGQEISLGARIVNLADSYDSMISSRSYRQTPFTKEEAREEIKKNSGLQFDPEIVGAFLKISDKI